ncbi:MAG: hypothetical protein ACQETI_05470, partial [Halobacteriota archaeon]
MKLKQSLLVLAIVAFVVTAPVTAAVPTTNDSTVTGAPTAAGSSADLAAFENTSTISANDTTPSTFADDIRVDDALAANTSAELLANNSSNVTMRLHVPENESNVSVLLNAAGTNISNVSNASLTVDGVDTPLSVVSVNNSTWIGF